MRYRLLLLLIAIFAITSTKSIMAQEKLDTIYNPNIIYTMVPKKYEIAGIKVTGVPNYDDYVIIGYSGLLVGETIELPGSEITNAAKRFWKQGLFSSIKIKVEKIYGNQAWLEIALKQQPRISTINYIGMKKSEKEDIQSRLGLVKGNQFTQNIADRTEGIVEAYYKAKGFEKAEVNVVQREDLSKENEVIVDIIADKHSKIKVNKIYISGNEVLDDKEINKAMKKTNEKGNIFNLFKQKKFVQEDFENDLDLIITKYNEKGYRDAKILVDSISNFDDELVDVHIEVEEGQRYYISDIKWIGNTLFATDVLDNVLGIKAGDVYNQTLIEERTQLDDDAVANLYMNRGYLFYSIIPIEGNISGDSISLEMRMMEGPQAIVNKVIINGNDRLYEKVVRRELRVKPGQLFSKSDLMRSAREISQTGHFNPETMDIRPEPNPDDGTVDLILNLESKSNDQVEFSAGWGSTGIIGKLSLKFTNFSLKNLFSPSSYKGVIPQGEGQQFSISAQTNAKYYQAYSVSFLDPWFGGKRPNALSVSAYYSRQTGVNSAYYSDNYYSYYDYSYGTNNYSYSSVEDAYDPNKVLMLAGLTVGFGKRLSWPDDYFTFTADLSYQWYYLNNWDYLYYMTDGISNSLTLGLTLARNSLDNPYYTRRGSSFSLSFRTTPPASWLVGNKDWKTLSEAASDGDTEATQELYSWIEYWKLKFNAKTYTPLTDPDGKWTLVLMSRADIGILGSYNEYLKSPFETFYVGGDGMSDGYAYATETVALRGYESGALTPWGYEGYAYTRFCFELHIPLLLEDSTTIYALTFLEAGNAWTSMSDFSPFDLKRSAGAGLRIFLPMVGLMGVDWAYGFDKVYGTLGGSNFHFILGQEF
ncbi:MAG: POTRA domain-containing protein [Bacteroidales bacterium]